jgi:hypothetical protein
MKFNFLDFHYLIISSIERTDNEPTHLNVRIMFYINLSLMINTEFLICDLLEILHIIS